MRVSFILGLMVAMTFGLPIKLSQIEKKLDALSTQCAAPPARETEDRGE